MKRAEKQAIKDKRWLSLGDVFEKQQAYLMSLDPDSEEYKEAQQAFKETNDILLKTEEEEEKLSWDKIKFTISVIVRCAETIGILAFTVIFCGYEATNSMTSKMWPIISKKLASLGLYSANI